MVKPDGTSNWTFQLGRAVVVPLVTVTLPSKPEPQSATLTKVAVAEAA